MLGASEEYRQKARRGSFYKIITAYDADVRSHFTYCRNAGSAGFKKHIGMGVNWMSYFLRRFGREDGLGTVEIVIIIAVLVGIALIFRDAIINFITDIMEGVFADDSIARDINSSIIRSGNQIN